MRINNILQGYESSKLLHYNDFSVNLPNTVAFEDLKNAYVSGVLKANRYVNGKLMQTYSSLENHVLTIAATRLGKTTSCVIPTIVSFAKQSVKRRMIISDPKGELYRLLAELLKEEGYDVLLLNLRDYAHSELWNPIVHIYKKYKRALNLEEEVCVVETPNGARNKFQGKVYEKQIDLDEAIDNLKRLLIADVDCEVDKIMFTLVPPDKANDQYWNEASRQWGKALIWSMLEDSFPVEGKASITEDTFSLNTMFSIADSLTDDNAFDDDDFFSKRGADSRAYLYSRGVVDNGNTTRRCIVACFNAKVQAFKNSTIRLITGCSSFEFERLTAEKPIAIFISYPDESKVYYQVISTFIQNAYTYLINYANEKPNGKLDVPFYFMLDEFGNFPKIIDFETVISACGGRNIWFNLVLQSYAQLDSVYGESIAEIIRDNLNVHVFLGSNNPSTLELFSKECGYTTRISPVSALNGSGDFIERYEVETIPLVPRSLLATLKPGECVVTEANCGYVLFSKMERYFTCKEYEGLKLSSDKDYEGSVNPLDKRFAYTPPASSGRGRRSKYNFDF